MSEFNIDEILGGIKSKAGSVTKTAVSVVEKKAKEGMLKHSYSEIQKFKNMQYAQIGKIIYKKYCNDGGFDEFEEYFTKITSLNQELENLKERVVESCGKKVCSECGEFVELDSEACPKCGTRV